MCGPIVKLGQVTGLGESNMTQIRVKSDYQSDSIILVCHLLKNNKGQKRVTRDFAMAKKGQQRVTRDLAMAEKGQKRVTCDFALANKGQKRVKKGSKKGPLRLCDAKKGSKKGHT